MKTWLLTVVLLISAQRGIGADNIYKVTIPKGGNCLKFLNVVVHSVVLYGTEPNIKSLLDKTSDIQDCRFELAVLASTQFVFTEASLNAMASKGMSQENITKLRPLIGKEYSIGADDYEKTLASVLGETAWEMNRSIVSDATRRAPTRSEYVLSRYGQALSSNGEKTTSGAHIVAEFDVPSDVIHILREKRRAGCEIGDICFNKSDGLSAEITCGPLSITISTKGKVALEAEDESGSVSVNMN